MSETRPNVVIWGDGGGSTFRATIDALDAATVDFNISGVITTSEDAGIRKHVTWANERYEMDIESLVVHGAPGRRQDETTQRSILEFLERRNSPNLVLMGAMVIMGKTLVTELNGKVHEYGYPRSINLARQEMVTNESDGTCRLPDSFPDVEFETGMYGLTNTHPAPTIVTANTHGKGAQERMVRMRSRDSGVTYHAVAEGIDTGPIIAAARFPLDEPLREDQLSDEWRVDQVSQQAFERAQRIEKAHLPLWVEMQVLRRSAYLAR